MNRPYLRAGLGHGDATGGWGVGIKVGGTDNINYI